MGEWRDPPKWMEDFATAIPRLRKRNPLICPKCGANLKSLQAYKDHYKAKHIERARR